jgi:resuscitation-promoting factor RpfA
MLIGPRWLTSAFLCIHHYEAAWNANTGNGYYGGLQMDLGFMRHYGWAYFRRWGTADRWPAWAQLDASERAYRSGRGFWPWPNTARVCGLL